MLEQKKDEQFVKTAKSHDYDGKDAASYGQLDAATAQTQQEHLQKTLRLMMAHASDAQGTQVSHLVKFKFNARTKHPQKQISQSYHIHQLTGNT